MESFQLPTTKFIKRDICIAAVQKANARARQELLTDDLGPILANISAQSIMVLKSSWAPFVVYDRGDSGYGMRLQIEHDPLALAALQQTNTYERIKEIGLDSFRDTFIEDNSFISMLLNDLIVEASK